MGHHSAGVSGEVLFHHLFRNPANDSGKAGQSGNIYDRFHKLVENKINL